MHPTVEKYLNLFHNGYDAEACSTEIQFLVNKAISEREPAETLADLYKRRPDIKEFVEDASNVLQQIKNTLHKSKGH